MTKEEQIQKATEYLKKKRLTYDQLTAIVVSTLVEGEISFDDILYLFDDWERMADLDIIIITADEEI